MPACWSAAQPDRPSSDRTSGSRQRPASARAAAGSPIAAARWPARRRRRRRPSVPPSASTSSLGRVEVEAGVGPGHLPEHEHGDHEHDGVADRRDGGQREPAAGVEHRGGHRAEGVEQHLRDEEAQQEGGELLLLGGDRRVVDAGGEQVGRATARPRCRRPRPRRARPTRSTAGRRPPPRRAAPRPAGSGRRRSARARPTARRRRAARTGRSTRCSTPGRRCRGRWCRARRRSRPCAAPPNARDTAAAAPMPAADRERLVAAPSGAVGHGAVQAGSTASAPSP